MLDPADFQSRLNALCDAFAAQLPAKLQHIDAAWRELSREAWDETGFQVLHRGVHSLTGSAAIFGFPLLSGESRQLEDYLKLIAQARTPASAKQRARIEMLLETFHQSIKPAPAGSRQ